MHGFCAQAVADLKTNTGALALWDWVRTDGWTSDVIGRSPIAKKIWETMNAKNFGLVMTSLLSAPLSVRPPARPSFRMQSHNANAPVFVWREVAWRDGFTTEMLKNTKYKANLYVFVGYVDKRGKERKREKKKTEKQGRLSEVQRERLELQTT